MTQPTQWKPGTSGNPKGRPKGARHRVTVLAEKLMAADAETIVRAVLTAASNGDMSAARMVLDRLVPPAKERPLSVDLPAADTLEGIAQAQAVIVAAVARGELLPGEGTALAGLLDARRRAIEATDLQARIEALEARQS